MGYPKLRCLNKNQNEAPVLQWAMLRASVKRAMKLTCTRGPGSIRPLRFPLIAISAQFHEASKQKKFAEHKNITLSKRGLPAKMQCNAYLP